VALGGNSGRYFWAVFLGGISGRYFWAVFLGGNSLVTPSMVNFCDLISENILNKDVFAFWGGQKIDFVGIAGELNCILHGAIMGGGTLSGKFPCELDHRERLVAAWRSRLARFVLIRGSRRLASD